MRSRLLVLLVAQAVLAPAACIEGIAGPDEDVMTQEEANALVQGLYGGNLLLLGESFLPGDPTTTPAVPPGTPLPINATIPCTGGGEAVFSGSGTISLAATQNSMLVQISGTLVARDCTFTADQVTFTLDSEGLEQSSSITIVQEDFTFAITITTSGSFSWTSGPRAGSCTLDNTITADLSLEDALRGTVPTATVSGSVCSLNVNREINLAVLSST